MGLHVFGDAGVAGDLPEALDDEDVGEHHAREEPKRARPAGNKIEVGVESPPLAGDAAPPRVYCACDILLPPAEATRCDCPACVAQTLMTKARAPPSAQEPDPGNIRSLYCKSSR